MKPEVKKNQRKLLKAVADAGDDGILVTKIEHDPTMERATPDELVDQAIYSCLTKHGLAEFVRVSTKERNTVRVYITAAGQKAADLL